MRKPGMAARRGVWPLARFLHRKQLPGEKEKNALAGPHPRHLVPNLRMSLASRSLDKAFFAFSPALGTHGAQKRAKARSPGLLQDHARVSSVVSGMVTRLLAVAALLGAAAAQDGAVAKRVADRAQLGHNLLRPDRWRPWRQGFVRHGEAFLCDNGSDPRVQRGASQTVLLNQREPRPIVATAWSKAERVGGSRNNDYALYLDLTYSDGTPLWGQTAPFNTGTHDWERRRVVVMPEKPIKRVDFHLLLRRHSGKAWFRGAELRELLAPEGGCVFDGVPVVVERKGREGFQVRDVAADSDFLWLERQALGLRLEAKRTTRGGASFIQATLTDTSGRERAVTLLYVVPVPGGEVTWFADPRRSEPARGNREFCLASRFRAGTGRLSRYPFAAVGTNAGGLAIGIDPMSPAFFRVGYNAATRELFVAYDLGLAPEKPSATVRFCIFAFEPTWGFRSALARFYELFPHCFRRRVSEQGLWMPFARISKVRGWQDFGFRFKEGTNETAWDDAHDILTFRYTEPMTWWMRMPAGTPRTLQAALAQARAMAAKGDRRAKALLTSGYHDETGNFFAHILDRPWCDGAVWSINSMPAIPGEATDFKNKWNEKLEDALYGPGRRIRGLQRGLRHPRARLPPRPLPRRPDPVDLRPRQPPPRNLPRPHRLRVCPGHRARHPRQGQAHDGQRHPGPPLLARTHARRPRQRPMSDGELLYRRSLCRAKPYCFLMNTRFEDFGPELVEKYMKRALAYGMFPGFFSPNASQGHYFTRPELYERDRPLFRKYLPLCKRVAEAGWEPITLAHSDDPRVHLERFGTRYLTVFNDSPEPRAATIALDFDPAPTSKELVTGKTIRWRERKTRLALGPEDVAVLDLAP